MAGSMKKGVLSDHPCECGCGKYTNIAQQSSTRHGYVKGQPMRFCTGHSLRSRLGEGNPRWRGPAATDDAKRLRAKNVCRELGLCRRCGHPAVHRHHRDRNIENNTPENIEPLCLACHRGEHDPELRKPRLPCIICGRISYRRASGKRCPTCAEYLRRYGGERPPRLFQRVTVGDPTYTTPACSNCGRIPGKKSSGKPRGLWLGRCDACALYYKNHGTDRPKDGIRKRQMPSTQWLEKGA